MVWLLYHRISFDYLDGELTLASLANGFAYWQYQEISNATKTYFDDMAQALAHVQEVAGSLDKIHFMNGGMS